MFNIPIPHMFWDVKRDFWTHPFFRKTRSINSAARRNRRLAKDKGGIGWFNPILMIGMLVPNSIPAAIVAVSPELNLANYCFSLPKMQQIVPGCMRRIMRVSHERLGTGFHASGL